jgi:hypothetical protein
MPHAAATHAGISTDITKLIKDVCERTVPINRASDHSMLARHQNTSVPELDLYFRSPKTDTAINHITPSLIVSIQHAWTNAVHYFQYGSHIPYTSNVWHTFYTFFNAEKLKCILNSRNAHLSNFFLKPTFKNWMHLKFKVRWYMLPFVSTQSAVPAALLNHKHVQFTCVCTDIYRTKVIKQQRIFFAWFLSSSNKA